MAYKDVAFKIRVEKELRQEFVAVCQSEDIAAAQVVRHFMRDYIAHHRRRAQGNLFETGGTQITDQARG